MRLCAFECDQFRCLREVRFAPGDGVNLIRGQNAQGKTSLLEAVLFAATSKSHRTNNESELVLHGAHWFRMSASARRSDRDVKIEAYWTSGAKRYRVNGVYQSRISDILGKIAVVMFSPEDLALVKGSASVRRHFLDMELSQISPTYLNALQRYRQVLRQRNELLKAHQPDTEQLDAWDLQLAEHGGSLMREREGFLRALSDAACAAYDHIAGGEKLALSYQPDLPEPDGIAASLAKSRAMDIRRQMTHHGPHRDDIELLIAGKPARSFGSQGQQKSAALAVKLAEIELVRQRTGEFPVFLLDEVLSELDAERAGRLVRAVNPEVQWLMTTTEADRPSVFGEIPCKRFAIEHGRLQEV